ncbi:MAG: hypothetical protein PHO32_04850 [Candidatus Cloacimonetes bacterium]|nr:hypothetical protein [Candidatus Cloacimonadota bacterium]
MLLAKSKIDPIDFWQGDYCIQSTVQPPAPNATSIKAKVDGKWQSYQLTNFPNSFWDWNRDRRLEYLEIFREMLEKGAEATRQPQLSGPHNGMVATYGAARNDSNFKLNNAVKGMGFLPRADKMAEITTLLESTLEAPLGDKLAILDSLYHNAEEVFAADRLVSLELYSAPDYTTQTFLNQMVNPACVTVFLDIPTYKIKQIARLIHPKDPKLSDYEKQACHYVNLIHSYFHGKFPKEYIAVIYYNTEIYDSSPGKKEARGTKISP